jgi:DoxX
MTSVDIASLILRLAVGLTIVAHGWNHAFGGGRIPGTARWFESIGLRPGRLHALMATGTELGAGALLAVGLLTPPGRQPASSSRTRVTPGTVRARVSAMCRALSSAGPPSRTTPSWTSAVQEWP